MKTEKSIDNIIFRVATEEDIPAIIDLVVDSFSKYDPLYLYLKLKKEDIVEFVSEDVISSIKLRDYSTVAEDKNTKRIVGCMLGLLFTLYDDMEHEGIITGDETNLDVKDLQNPDFGLKLLCDIEAYFFKKLYDDLQKKNELENTVMCEYFCVHKDYTGTKLTYKLTTASLLHYKQKEIKNIYALLFNHVSSYIFNKVIEIKTLQHLKFNIIDGGNIIKRIDLHSVEATPIIFKTKF